MVVPPARSGARNIMKDLGEWAILVVGIIVAVWLFMGLQSADLPVNDGYGVGL